MTTGLPKQPSVGSILLGIGLVIVVLLAFLRLPEIVKFGGATLMYLPAKLGLIDMVGAQDIIPFSLAENPSSITIPAPGQYLLYLENYDLLVVHDAIVASNSKPWIKIRSQELNTELAITMIERGLTWYDTPFAAGRPVIAFKVDRPGVYLITHPTRLDTARIVPDAITGKETRIKFWASVELVLLAGIIMYVVRKRTASRRQQRIHLLAQNRARVENQRKRIRQQAEEKRREEDQPYWKKH